ncbi:MAG: histidine phosphatase family protein [Actinomycetota bacterium]|nr:histidine phosphatase family protein [Actinomycetota bacterium]
MSSRNRTLVLMRHAKAEAFGAEDQARALTDRGRRDAAEAGLWLAAKGLVPDHALVSSAARAVATWEAVAAASRSAAAPVYDESLYSAGPETTLEVLNTVEPVARVLIFVGHNPTAAYLAHVLSDSQPDPEAFRAMSQGYPTAALTVLEVPVKWADLTEGAARITDFHVGHG